MKTKRIEIDNIQQKVGAEKIWEYIMYRLQLPEFNKGFDYAKVIEMPQTENLRPKIVKNVMKSVDTYLAVVTEKRNEEIVKELENTKKLIEKSKKENEIEVELTDKVSRAEEYDDGIKTIIAKFKEIIPILPKPESYREPD